MTQIGVVFPQGSKEVDAAGVREFGLGVERLGYKHVLASDHVVGADPEVHEGWSGPYDVTTRFHEPLTMFAFLAGLTSLEFISWVVILPQRQTVLVAKQAAEVDLLSGGKLRLGVGVGWNEVEYEALGVGFTERGKRLDEQIEVLRRLWTEQSVSFDGKFHTITGAGLEPLPAQRPIPIDIGGTTPAALRRTGRLADGWLPLQVLGIAPERLPAPYWNLPPLDESLATIAEAARAANRDPASIQVHGVAYYLGDVQEVVDQVGAWREHGAAAVSVSTLQGEFGSVGEHLDALAQVADGLRSANYLPSD